MEESWLDMISPFLRPALRGDISVTHTWHAPTCPGWVEPQRVIYDHELVIVRQGRYVVDIAGTEYPCAAGTFIIIPPGRSHVSWDAANEAGYRAWAHFDWVWQGSYERTPLLTFAPAQPQTAYFRYAPEFIPKKIFHGPIASPAHVYDLCERLGDRQHHGSAHEKRVSRALLLELLLELLDPRCRREDEPTEKHHLAHRVRDILEQMVAQNRKTPSMQLLLEELGYSYAHLCRLFHARYGISPLKYVHALRFSRAKLLLRDTDLSIAEITYRVGFDDPNYFRQLFHKNFGLSPSAYARKVREE